MAGRLTRRDVLRRGAGAVFATGCAALGGYLLHDPHGRRGLGTRAQSVRRLPNYFADVGFPGQNPRMSMAMGDVQRMEQVVRAAIGGLDPDKGMRRFIRRGDVVLIKPNVGFDRPPALGATTHPEVLRWVIRLCREAGTRRILVTDHPIESPAACFARTGISRVVEEEGAEILLPAQRHFAEVGVRDCEPDRGLGEVLHHWPMLHAPLAEATKVIGVAPVKDHNLASASMNLKNWYGLLGERRSRFHQAIHETISDLALLMSPTLVVADATRVMMRNGPTGGRLSDISPGGVLGRPTVVASVDPVACDAWCYENLLGRDPDRLAYLGLARDKIRARVVEGEARFGESDWRAYDARGLVTMVNV